ncbi:MAG: poly(R)-hydroxyalkanoic acid synthase subunit PhaE [Planctomycetota bacterium]|nr:poly(R)-hydroxyalkanoic acid synthase subunit PhaE [Planctomycetota bacterium]MDI6787435.1 poly(R)-hydroxyalkanoic acid synthase subunit PhaE [Planctomycetota bacterium]
MPEKRETESQEQTESPSNPFFDMWNKFAGSFKSHPFMQMDLSGAFPQWFKAYDDIAKKFYSVPLSGVVGEVFPKFVDTADVYMRLFKSWADAAGRPNVSPDLMKNFFSIWSDSQKEIFSKLFGLPLPDALGGNIQEWNELIKNSLENFSRFYTANYQPFIENWNKISQETDKILREKPDPTKYKEFYSTLMQGYESALGKFIKMPMVGPSRLLLEKVFKSIDAFIKYYTAIVDFNMVFYSPGKETVEELARKATDLLKGEVTQEKYKQFYELLIKTFEDRFFQLFKTPAFTEVIRRTLDSYLDFRKQHFAVMEEMLKATPIITRTEIDDVYQELYNLKKRIKELERHLKGEKTKKDERRK